MISSYKGSQKSPSPLGKSWCSLSTAQSTPCSLQMVCGASPPLSPTNTSTSTFFSFDFLAGIVRIAVTTVTEPLCHQTSTGHQTSWPKSRRKPVQCWSSKTNLKEGGTVTPSFLSCGTINKTFLLPAEVVAHRWEHAEIPCLL